MKPRTWEWSNKDEEQFKPTFKTVTEGEQYLYIDDVTYDPDTQKYLFEITSLAETGGSFRQFQNLMKKDGSGPNYMAVKWLNSLGYACSGVRTILQADEMKGCVFLATVNMEPAFADKARYEEDMKTKGVSDVRLYPTIRPDTILPVGRDLEPFSTHVDEETGEKDQFFIDE